MKNYKALKRLNPRISVAVLLTIAFILIYSLGKFIKFIMHG